MLAIVERNLARRELVRMFSIVSAEATHPEHEAHAWLLFADEPSLRMLGGAALIVFATVVSARGKSVESSAH